MPPLSGYGPCGVGRGSKTLTRTCLRYSKTLTPMWIGASGTIAHVSISGVYPLVWDASNQSSGIYIVKAEFDGLSTAQKLLLVK